MPNSRVPALSILVLIATVHAAPAQPSFDCSRALTATERQICGRDHLSSLDREMATLYGSVVGSGDARLRVAIGLWQKTWLRQRDICGADATCIDRQYRGRIAELRAVNGAAGGGPSTASQTRRRVLADGTLVVREPGKGTRRWQAEKRRYQRKSQVAGDGRDWALAYGDILLTILANLLSEENLSTYLGTESGLHGNALVDYRLQWVAELTAAGS